MNIISKNIAIGLAEGLFASWIKSLAEPPLQHFGERTFPPSANQLALKGADANGHPENMPPSVLAQKAYYTATGKTLAAKDTLQAMKVIHYTMGAAIGVVYVTMLNRNKKLLVDKGLLAGAAVWAATHGTTVPALGLQGQVKDMPKSWWVWEFGSHLIFGLALEQSRRLLNTFFN